MSQNRKKSTYKRIQVRGGKAGKRAGLSRGRSRQKPGRESKCLGR